MARIGEMKTRIYRPTPHNIRNLGAMLAKGRLVAVPAETVYGLAADATNPVACAEIFAAKGRPAHDPLIVHVSSLAQAKRLAEWNPTATALAKAFWPGPLTIVLKRKEVVPDIVTSGLSTVAVRFPSHPLFRKLLRAAGTPLAAPSANPFGYISPTTAEHVKSGLAGRIPAILDGGECPVGVESTIVDASSSDTVQLLRPGAVSKADIASCLGLSATSIESSRGTPDTTAMMAPGMMERHYSPRKITKLWERFPQKRAQTQAWVYFGPSGPRGRWGRNHLNLSPRGSGQEAAKNLYRILRELDDSEFEKINLQRIPPACRWAEALNDRMKRAASG